MAIQSKAQSLSVTPDEPQVVEARNTKSGQLSKPSTCRTMHNTNGMADLDHPKSEKEEDIEHTEPNFTRAKRSQLVLELKLPQKC